MYVCMYVCVYIYIYLLFNYFTIYYIYTYYYFTIITITTIIYIYIYIYTYLFIPRVWNHSSRLESLETGCSPRPANEDSASHKRFLLNKDSYNKVPIE